MGAYANPFAPTATAQPSGATATPAEGYNNPFAASTPAPATSPASTTPFSGKGYGAAAQLDLPGQKSNNSSPLGRPLAVVPETIPKTFMSPQTTAEVIDPNRVAPNFDPTVPQKLTPDMLENGRMPESASQAERAALGATPDQELDHIISLELSGSNQTTNLRLEQNNPGMTDTQGGAQPSAPLEDALAKKVISGQISLVDAQRQIAQAKGYTLTEDKALNNPINQFLLNNPEILKPMAGVQSTVEDATNSGDTFNELGGNAIVHPLQTLSNIVTKASTDITGTLQAFLDSAAKVVVNGQQAMKESGGNVNAPDYTNPKNAGDIINLLTAAASTLFLPVSETFSIASQLPVIKPAADAAGLLFSKTGQLTGFSALKLLNALPISQSTKDALQQPIENVASLAGQIVLGGYIYGKVTDAMVAKPGAQLSDFTADDIPASMNTKTEKAIVDDANTKSEQINSAPIPDSPKPTLDDFVKAQTPEQTNLHPKQDSPEVDLAPKGSVTDITPPEKSPSMMDAIMKKFTQGKEVQDILPPKTPVTVDGSDSTFKVTSDTGNKNVKVVDLSTGNEEEVPRTSVNKADPTGDEPVKTRNVNQLKPIEGTGESKTRGLSKSVEAGAIQNGLADTLGDLPQYKSVDMADQAQKVQELIQNDPERAKRIAMGEENGPKGIIPEAVHTALRLQAAAEGDGELAKDLANSKLSAQATTFGQRIQALKGANPEDPVAAIREVQQAREEALKAKADDETKKAEASIKQATADRVSGKVKVDWQSFVKSLQC